MFIVEYPPEAYALGVEREEEVKAAIAKYEPPFDMCRVEATVFNPSVGYASGVTIIARFACDDDPTIHQMLYSHFEGFLMCALDVGPTPHIRRPQVTTPSR